MQGYAIVLSFKAGSTEAEESVKPKWFRPGKFYTDVTAEGLAWIDGLYIGDDIENQLLDYPIDAWVFSAHNVEEQQKVFLKEHGLEGKLMEEIENYLDDNELSMPDVPILTLPTISAGSRIRITGTFPQLTGLTFLGYVP